MTEAPRAAKRGFLETRGLTEEEIEMAFQTAEKMKKESSPTGISGPKISNKAIQSNSHSSLHAALTRVCSPSAIELTEQISCRGFWRLALWVGRSSRSGIMSCRLCGDGVRRCCC